MSGANLEVLEGVLLGGGLDGGARGDAATASGGAALREKGGGDAGAEGQAGG